MENEVDFVFANKHSFYNMIESHKVVFFAGK